MELGWIDFSKEERAKVLDVIRLLAEETALDELGIAPIRDGFANIFFPGTSTIQTRAKYFLIVPYALSDLEHNFSKANNPKAFMKEMTDLERHCAEVMLAKVKSDEKGIVGSVSLQSGNWVKRTPLDIYWNGIRTYGILMNRNLSYQEYVTAVCAIKNNKKNIKSFKPANEDLEEFERDDLDAGGIFSVVFWKLPKYDRNNWQSELRIDLTPAEASFLKNQIISSCPESLFSFLLSENIRESIHCSNFTEFTEAFLPILPRQIQEDVILSNQVSEFIYALKVRYNFILSHGESEVASTEWSDIELRLDNLANIPLDDVFWRLDIRGKHISLYVFLKDVRACLIAKDFSALDDLIIKREHHLKGSRAKLMKKGTLPIDAWYGGGRLEYRFSNAMILMKDIFEGEEIENA